MDNRSDKWGSVGRGKKFPQIDALNVVPSWGIATRFSTQERGNPSSLPCMIIILSCGGTLSSCESTAQTNIDYS